MIMIMVIIIMIKKNLHSVLKLEFSSLSAPLAGIKNNNKSLKLNSLTSKNP